MEDLISRQAAIEAVLWGITHAKAINKDTGEVIELFRQGNEELTKAADRIKELPSVQEQQWIPVKMRPMDSEEREYFEDQFGEKLEDEDAVMFDCPMPDDGQEILVSYRKWISMDKCEIVGGYYWLEENGDWKDVIAWMPSPEPYKGEK